MLHRLEFVMENEEVLVFPSDTVKLVEIEDTWLWTEPEETDQDPVVTFDSARICLSAKASVHYSTSCGISSMNQLERIARFRDIVWIDLIYTDQQVESFFAPYEDEYSDLSGSPNRLMQAGWDEQGNLWIFIDRDFAKSSVKASSDKKINTIDQ